MAFYSVKGQPGDCWKLLELGRELVSWLGQSHINIFLHLSDLPTEWRGGLASSLGHEDGVWLFVHLCI